ncbi:hypothetical protein [Noviherbaspirillum malthae]|uniref:hypothetical protein n=1 Tax=Noviherbaspirillum malthae TaxID=1260987 RepID=UPI00188DE6C0|nr:hypothetical protein [Noviherbaspirillum malthae]
MEVQEKPQFVELLKRTMGAYSKPLPESTMLVVWWDLLKGYPLSAVAAAMATYIDQNGEFEPKPAGIAKLCKLMDGRPGVDEAWAIALTSRNEADTVVWTRETAEAFAACMPVLSTGDEVGARMAFKDAYNRLVSEARLAGKPASWTVSLGWDKQKREAALEHAQAAGLLPAPAVQALLPAPAKEEVDHNGLARLKEELKKLIPAGEKMAQRRAAERQAERDDLAARKADIQKRIKSYQSETKPSKPAPKASNRVRECHA